MDEILNIEYHVKRLLLKALNKHDRIDEAAEALGISLRSLLRYRQTYGIGKNKEGLYYLKPQKNIVLYEQVN